MGEILAARAVAIVYPDREPGGIGTLFIPNVLAITKGAPHREAAEALADYLLSPEVEAKLAEGPGVQIPLLSTTRAAALVETPKTVPRHARRLRGRREALGQGRPLPGGGVRGGVKMRGNIEPPRRQGRQGGREGEEARGAGLSRFRSRTSSSSLICPWRPGG